MSDDLAQKVAEAIRRTREFQATAAFGLPDAEAIRLASTAWARIALDAIIAQGGVTDEAISADISAAMREQIGGNAYGPAIAATVEAVVPPIRDLMARGIATACAERDAEIERQAGVIEALTDTLSRAHDYGDEQDARAERAEAQVQRVRELADTIDAELDAIAEAYKAVNAEPRVTSRIREALDGEADR